MKYDKREEPDFGMSADKSSIAFIGAGGVEHPIVTAQTSPGGGIDLFAGGAGVKLGGRFRVGRPARVIYVGNSLVDSYGGYSDASGWWSANSFILHTIQRLGPLIDMRNRMTVGSDSNYWDRWGNIGHGGATLDTITADILTSGVLAQMATDSVLPPDIVVGAALLENDIAGGASFETCKTRLLRYLDRVEAVWPGVNHLIATPWASVNYNTADKRQVADQVRAYILSLPSLRENVDAADVSRLYCGDDWIPYPGLTDGIHPANTTTTVPARVGRVFAAALRRMLGGQATFGLQIKSPNIGLTGSIAASAPATGTAPSNTIFSGAAITGGSVVSVAENPGWKITYTNADGGAEKDFGTFALTGIVPSDLTKVDPVISFEIESGAENVVAFTVQVRMRYSDLTNDFRDITRKESSYVNGEWLDGEGMNFVAPRVLPTDGKTLTSVEIYVKLHAKAQVGTTVIRVKALGTL
jgi:hypothetical protein